MSTTLELPRRSETPLVDSVLSERIARLEERTAPKPVSALDRLKNWGGVASLAIALAYSFPAGLWDRFIVGPQQELEKLRAVVEQSATLWGEAAKTLTGLGDPAVYDSVSRSFNTRLWILMFKHREAFDEHAEKLETPELLVVAYNYTAINEPERAVRFLKVAEERAGDNVIAKAEAMRLRAKLHFQIGKRDTAGGRATFREALSLLSRTPSPQTRAAAAYTNAEWGYLELVAGDWQCGEERIRDARAEYARISTFVNDNGQFLRMIDSRVSALAPTFNQPASGC